MDKKDLQDRTKQFALRIIKMTEALPNTKSANVISNQILRSGISAAANYRAALRGKSDADFLYKISIVTEEADETLFWLEIIEESGMLPSEKLKELKKEADELTAIFTATAKKTKEKINKSKNGI
jgi:four helix bundle protein